MPADRADRALAGGDRGGEQGISGECVQVHHAQTVDSVCPHPRQAAQVGLSEAAHGRRRLQLQGGLHKLRRRAPLEPRQVRMLKSAILKTIRLSHRRKSDPRCSTSWYDVTWPCRVNAVDARAHAGRQPGEHGVAPRHGAAEDAGAQARVEDGAAQDQGLTLVHFSAQLKRFLWHRGYIEGLFRGYFEGV